MKIIQPSVVIENQDWQELLRRIESKGRVCYKSEDRITDDSADLFIESIAKRGHLSVLEHSSISVKFVVDRGVSHEIVRHRLASYSQESTRYCNYADGKFGNQITVIEPFFFGDRISRFSAWCEAMAYAEEHYDYLLSLGATPQEARSVLPNSLKTEIWMTANLREWLHFFTLRCSKAAHPQMRQVAIPLLLKLKELLSPIFGGVEYDKDFPAGHYAEVVIEG
jgi:thymidylate synthase, flavin-dependent